MVDKIVAGKGRGVASLYPDLPQPVEHSDSQDSKAMAEKSRVFSAIRPKPRPFDPRDHAQVLAFFRRKAGVPYEPPSRA